MPNVVPAFNLDDTKLLSLKSSQVTLSGSVFKFQENVGKKRFESFSINCLS